MAMQNGTVLKIVLTAAVAVGGVVFFVKSTLGNSVPYYMVDTLVEGQTLDKFGDQQLQVHGWVVAGSLKEKVINQQTIRTFVLQKEGKKIRVFNKGPKPDTFSDQAEVVATGRIVAADKVKDVAAELGAPLEDAYVVEATDLSAKCPSKYDGANANRNLVDKYEK